MLVQIGPMRVSKVGAIFSTCLCLLILLYAKAVFLPGTFLTSTSQKICLKELLVASIEAAERGGNKVVEVKKNPRMVIKSKGKTLEGVNDPVTLGDMLSHQQMYFSLLKMWPDLHIVSEEKSDEVPHQDDIKPINLDTEEIEKLLSSSLHSDVRLEDVTVWIDPLDATKEYTENKLEYVTTMVCVALKGRPIIGVIHRPFQRQTVWAWKGHGRSDIPDYQTNIADVHGGAMKIIVSMSHAGEVSTIVKRSFGNDTIIIPAGGAGYKALKVAQRNAHAYIHTTAIKKWDICAGNALLETMGGSMKDLQGSDIDYSWPTGDRKNVKLHNGLLATFTKEEDQMLSKFSRS